MNTVTQIGIINTEKNELIIINHLYELVIDL